MSDADDEDPDRLAIIGLKIHNKCRENHGVSPLKLSKKLCKLAKEWAQICSDVGMIVHRNQEPYGESIYFTNSSETDEEIALKEAVKSWYKEYKLYDFGVETLNKDCLRFTQIVWKNSKKLGMGVSKHETNGVYVVANYSPRGNIVGEFMKNVLQCKKKDEEIDEDDQSTDTSAIQKSKSSKGGEGKSPKITLSLCENCCKKFIQAETERYMQKNERRGSGDDESEQGSESLEEESIREDTDETDGNKSMRKKRKSKRKTLNERNKRSSVTRADCDSCCEKFDKEIEKKKQKNKKLRKQVSLSVMGNQPDTFDEFQTECLKAHNMYRVKHGVPALILSATLCNLAAEWAEECALVGEIIHRTPNPFGESIYHNYTDDPKYKPSAKYVVKRWYDESKDYDFTKEDCRSNFLVFTQIIWEKTKKLGVAWAKSENGEVFVVAFYYPRGNIVGQFLKNVHKESSNPEIEGKSADGTEELESIPEEDEVSVQDRGVETEEGLIDKNKEIENKSVETDKTKEDEEEEEILKEDLIENETMPEVEGVPPEDGDGIEEDAAKTDTEKTEQTDGESKSETVKSDKAESEVEGSKDQGSRGGDSRRKSSMDGSRGGDSRGKSSVRAGSKTETLSKDKSKLDADTVSTTSSLDEDTENFANEGLRLHNKYRKIHGAPPLKLNKTLCKLARDWAKRCAETEKLASRNPNVNGENIYYMYAPGCICDATAKEAVKNWYDEGVNYKYGQEKGNEKCIHFTQVVWKSTTQVGMGRSHNEKGEAFVVAYYKPKGNIPGKYKENVLKPKNTK